MGEYWFNIHPLETRGTCLHCDETEDMDHILFDCKATGREEVWALTQSLWKMKGGTWPNPRRTSDAIAATMADLRTPSGRRRPGATRLYKILVT